MRRVRSKWRRWGATRLGAGVASMASLVAVPARAQPSTTDAVTAQALFEEGKRLLLVRRFAEACPKLAESQRLDPGGGTMLLLAICHEGEGKTATAWAEFHQALTRARVDHRADREAAASEHIRELEPKLVRVRVEIAPGSGPLELRRDGQLAGQAQWSVPVPTDPGVHTFEARAPGKKLWSTTVQVEGEGKTIEVRIPVLEDAAPPPVATAAAPEPPVSAAAPPREEPPSTEGSRSLVWPLVAGGVGVVATGVGVALYASASSKWSEVSAVCTGNRCPNDAYVAAGEAAGRRADMATGFFVVGGLGIAAGALLFFVAPRASREESARLRFAPAFGHGGGGLTVGGNL